MHNLVIESSSRATPSAIRIVTQGSSRSMGKVGSRLTWSSGYRTDIRACFFPDPTQSYNTQRAQAELPAQNRLTSGLRPQASQ